MPFNHLIFYHPFLLLPSIFPSIRVFSEESALRIRSPKYWSFSFSISPSNEYSGLISFRIDWLALLAVQGTLKSLLQHHNLKVSSSVLSLLYGPALTYIYDYWKKHSFDYRTFVGKVMSLLSNNLSLFVLAFLSRRCMYSKSLQSCPTLCDPMDIAHQVLLSMGFFRQKYWSGLPSPSREDLPDPGIEPVSLKSRALAVGSLPLAPPGEPLQGDSVFSFCGCSHHLQ